MTNQCFLEGFTNPMPERIALLTGGTGFLGSRISITMNREGWLVRHLSRNEPAGHVMAAEWIQGDIRDPEACNRAANGAALIIHAAGEKKHDDLMHAVNVEGTCNLLNAALENKVELFIHISSVGVIGADPLRKMVWDENSPCAPNNDYEWSKWRAEEKVRDASAFGLKSVILRPTNIFGDRDPSKGLLSLIKKVRSGGFVFLGGRNSICNFVFVEDVAHAVLTITKNRGISEGVYNVADPCTLGEFADAVADALRVRRPSISMPEICADSLRRAIGCLYGWSCLKQRDAISRLISLNNQTVFISEKLYRETGFQNSVGWREGVKRLVNWYRDQGDL